MAAYIEANSLSDITQIASHPPKYPRNPTEERRNPLILYIARVPGSKDIILTTLRPQVKNVTAEDVASSLYYFHLNTEEDARLLAEGPEDLPISPTEHYLDGEKQLPRKPLPDTSRSSLDFSSLGESVPAQTPSNDLHRKPLPVPARNSMDSGYREHASNRGQMYVLSRSSTGLVRKSVASESQSLSDRQAQNVAQLQSSSHHQVNEVIQRKPLGPRPIGVQIQTERKRLPGVENQPSTYRPQLQDVTPSGTSDDYGRSEALHHGAIKTDGGAKAFFITIIRRDPSSGAQWNIGTVTGVMQDQGVEVMQSAKKPCFDISVNLVTPGYSVFRDSHRSFGSEDQPHVENQRRTDGKFGSPSFDRGFHRQVTMAGSGFFERVSKQRKRSHSSPADLIAAVRGTAAAALAEIASSTNETQDSTSKGYVFVSPWGGRCKFTTGVSGRSLRCKHTLPQSLSSSNAVFESSASTDVSELKFNLPHATTFKATASKAVEGVVGEGHSTMSKLGHIRDKIAQASRPVLPPRPHVDPMSYAAMYPSDGEEGPPLPSRQYAEERPSDLQNVPAHPQYTPKSPNEEDDERLDLSMGRERAGGGNRGKRAKLGKLVIHDEGFKMLDLLVAANMGVWWSVFDTHHSNLA